MDRIMDPHGLFLMTNGSCYQVGEKLVLQMTRRSTWECRFRSGDLPLLCLCLCIHQKSESEVMIFNPKSITDFNQFEGTIWAKCNMMEKICQKCDFGLKEILKKNTDSTEKSNKCNQCDFASFLAGDLRTHLTMHSEEKSNKCNQCDYAFSEKRKLVRHLKTHSGEKPNESNQCDYATSEKISLVRHLNIHSGEKPKNVTMQCIVTLAALV